MSIFIRNQYYCSNRLWNFSKVQVLHFCDNTKGNNNNNNNKDNDEANATISNTESSETSQTKDANIRLNKLLTSMSNENLKKIKTATPGKKIKTIIQENKVVKEDNITSTDNILKATKNVANAIGGDVKRTESELLSKLLSYANLSQEGKIKNDPNKLDFNKLMMGMKIDKGDMPTVSPTEKRSQFVRKVLSEPNDNARKHLLQKPIRRPRQQHEIRATAMAEGTRINLFGEKPLGIFTNSKELIDTPDTLLTWSKLQEKEIKLSVTHPPTNYFQKMALWTDQGKLWKFPINNEQGLDKESNVYFTDHIFTEQYIEDWCPKIGPVRNFMELVCVGLSKNPYLSVDEKKEHINWFRNYFEEKKTILQNIMIENADTSKPKEIEN